MLSNPAFKLAGAFRWNLAYDYFDIGKAHALHLRSVIEALDHNLDARTRCETSEAESDLQERADSLDEMKGKAALVTVVFCAMCLEAVINDFGSTFTSQGFFEKHFDKLKPESKWILIPRFVTGKSISSDSQGYEHLLSLFKTRNKIVHFKPRDFDHQDRKSFDRYTGDKQKITDAAFDGIRAVFSSTTALREISVDYSPQLEYFLPVHHPNLQEYA